MPSVGTIWGPQTSSRWLSPGSPGYDPGDPLLDPIWGSRWVYHPDHVLDRNAPIRASASRATRDLRPLFRDIPKHPIWRISGSPPNQGATLPPFGVYPLLRGYLDILCITLREVIYRISYLRSRVPGPNHYSLASHRIITGKYRPLGTLIPGDPEACSRPLVDRSKPARRGGTHNTLCWLMLHPLSTGMGYYR